MLTTDDTHPLRGPGHGVWAATGLREFGWTFLALQFDQNRAFVSTEKVRGRTTLNEAGDEYNGVIKADFLDRNGNVIASREGAVQGSRIRIEPL